MRLPLKLCPYESYYCACGRSLDVLQHRMRSKCPKFRLLVHSTSSVPCCPKPLKATFAGAYIVYIILAQDLSEDQRVRSLIVASPPLKITPRGPVTGLTKRHCCQPQRICTMILLLTASEFQFDGAESTQIQYYILVCLLITLYSKVWLYLLLITENLFDKQ